MTRPHTLVVQVEDHPGVLDSIVVWVVELGSHGPDVRTERVFEHSFEPVGVDRLGTVIQLHHDAERRATMWDDAPRRGAESCTVI